MKTNTATKSRLTAKAKKYSVKNSCIYQPKESDLCKLFFHKVKSLQAYKQFSDDFIIFHIANENISSPAYRQNLYRMGLLPGVADYCILYRGGRVAFIEFKRDIKSRQTPKQVEFHEECLNFEIPYLLTFDIDQAIKWIHELLSANSREYASRPELLLCKECHTQLPA